MKNRKKHIHRKFNKIVKTIVASDDTKKYAVSKLSKNKYAYHDFVIIRADDESYNCTIKDVLIYGDIASFQLAISYCYNYLFKKSPRILTQLNELNEAASREQINLMYYKHYVNNAEEGDREFMYARISESTMIFNQIKSKIRSLSTTI